MVIGLLPWWSLLTLLSLNKAWEAVRGFVGKSLPVEMLPAMKSTAQTNTLYGLLLGASLLLQMAAAR